MNMNLFHRWYCRSGSWRKTLTEGLDWVLDGVDLGGDVLEIGPGPGLTTDMLLQKYSRITAIEIDAQLASALKARLDGSGIRVVRGSAAELPFPDKSFSGAAAITMLHHVPNNELQDRLFSEACRVLVPGGIFVGSDSLWSPFMQLIHLFDVMNLVDPDTLGHRLEQAGFEQVNIEVGDGTFRFQARRPN